MEYIFKILLLTEAASLIYGAPTETKGTPGVERAEEYFNKYSSGFAANGFGAAGVASTENAEPELNLKDNPIFREYLVNFQIMANIEPNGIVNDDTLEKMEESRCGVPDPQTDPNAPGKYEVQSRWWSKKNRRTGFYMMTYTFSKKDTPDDLKFQSFRKGVILAMCQWELISNVRFRFLGVAKKNADIVISYEKRNHGDGYSFDGKGGTLGHAFYPEDGRVHLDLEEAWYLASAKNEDARKKDVYTAALHEFGHTIGLLHSKDREAIMAPFYRYRGLFGSFSMPGDEIAGVENMYGERIDSNPATERYSACREARRRYKINVSPTKTAEGTATAPTPRPTEEPFEAVPCEDDPFHAERHCPAWKARNLCEVAIFAPTMHKRCKKTCGFCPGSKMPTKAGQLTSKSICNIKSFDSFMTTYDESDGFSALIFKDNYYFKMQVALMPEKYSTHSLLNVTEDITGSYKFDTDPRSITPGLFKIQTPNFFVKTSKAEAAVFVGKRYFTFQGKQMHLYTKDMTGTISYETTFPIDEIFYGFNASKVDAAHASVNEIEDTVTFTLFSGCNMWQYKEYRDQGNDTLLMVQITDKIDVNISEWHGVPACSVDSVFYYRGVPYFLKGNVFWPATISEPQVPRDITYNFFRCWENEPTDIEIPSLDDVNSGGRNGESGQHITSTFSILLVVFINHIVTKLIS